MAEMISKDSEVTPYKTDRMATYFLDRNPRFFDFIPDYLCDPLKSEFNTGEVKETAR